MSTGYFILFGCILGMFAFLLWMLYTLSDRREAAEKEKIRGACPLCSTGLRKGERIRSDVTEIGDVEVRTKIKGCPFCMDGGRRKRTCPVCKKKVPPGEVILAIADPQVDRHKLSIRGCKKCYPQGF